MSADDKAPIIIKKKKGGGGEGHHGGAWKVAYADFVTAMMAFFLLMWLLNATTESQRKGLADYFSPTIPLSRTSGGGDGSFGGDSVFSEETLSQNGQGAAAQSPTESRKSRGSTGVNLSIEQESATPPKDEKDEEEEAELKAVEEVLLGHTGESLVSELAMRHVITRVTDEGLVVEVFDLPGVPLFAEDGTPTDSMRYLSDLFAAVFGLVSNGVALSGHVMSQPSVFTEVDAWAASQSRADAARQLLEERGFQRSRIRRVTGFADREPVTRNPMAVRNNRVEYILLRSDK
ncbi:MAG: flagellar motor protein MotB [Pseudomonadota bacterium]